MCKVLIQGIVFILPDCVLSNSDKKLNVNFPAFVHAVFFFSIPIPQVKLNAVSKMTLRYFAFDAA